MTIVYIPSNNRVSTTNKMNFFEKFRVLNGKSTHKWVDKLGNYIRALNDGVYAVTVKEYKSKRSLEQNKYYWKILEIIGEDLGYYKEELHEEFIDAFSPIKTIRGLNGKPKQKRVRTSEMNVEQMSKHIERIIHFAAENSIVIPEKDYQ